MATYVRYFTFSDRVSAIIFEWLLGEHEEPVRSARAIFHGVIPFSDPSSDYDDEQDEEAQEPDEEGGPTP